MGVVATLAAVTLETGWLPWTLAAAGAVAVAYERIVGRGVWRTVAEGREQRINDLETHVKRQDIEIAQLRGEMKALYALKTTDIVTGVLEGLRPFMLDEEIT